MVTDLMRTYEHMIWPRNERLADSALTAGSTCRRALGGLHRQQVSTPRHGDNPARRQ
jgi:hypothetical protein